MNATRLDETILSISEKLDNLPYAFIGSINLYLQGLEVSPRDIDILTTPEGIKEIDERLKKSRTREIYFDETNGRNSFRSFYRINDIEIEVLGNVNNECRRTDCLDNRIFVTFHGRQTPCIPLSEEVCAYRKMGREDKVKMIEEFMQKG